MQLLLQITMYQCIILNGRKRESYLLVRLHGPRIVSVGLAREPKVISLVLSRRLFDVEVQGEGLESGGVHGECSLQEVAGHGHIGTVVRGTELHQQSLPPPWHMFGMDESLQQHWQVAGESNRATPIAQPTVLAGRPTGEEGALALQIGILSYHHRPLHGLL